MFLNAAVCRKGYELWKSDRKCHACQPGFYKDAIGSGACAPCPPGYWYPGRGALQCTTCSKGLVDATRSKCQCEGGRFCGLCSALAVRSQLNVPSRSAVSSAWLRLDSTGSGAVNAVRA